MELSSKALSICHKHYISYKTPGCSKCPIQQECHGRQIPKDKIEQWITEINLAAEKVSA